MMKKLPSGKLLTYSCQLIPSDPINYFESWKKLGFLLYILIFCNKSWSSHYLHEYYMIFFVVVVFNPFKLLFLKLSSDKKLQRLIVRCVTISLYSFQVLLLR